MTENRVVTIRQEGEIDDPLTRPRRGRARWSSAVRSTLCVLGWKYQNRQRSGVSAYRQMGPDRRHSARSAKRQRVFLTFRASRDHFELITLGKHARILRNASRENP